MITFKHTIPAAFISSLCFGACVVDDVEDTDRLLLDDDDGDEAHDSLEQALDLIPQLLTADQLSDAGTTLDGRIPRYLIMSVEAGGFELGPIAISDESEDARPLVELFATSPPVREGVLEQDALLLLSVPTFAVEELCDRFRVGHHDGDVLEVDRSALLSQVAVTDELSHALCLMPRHAVDTAATELTADADAQTYGGGTYTMKVKTLECNDPRDWENWPYNGDEARLRAFYDGAGGAQIWEKDGMKSNSPIATVNRYVHFNNNAKLELYDYDSGLWNANDKLGQEWIYSNEACAGDHMGDFDGSGGGHNWNYDLIYRVYGPACPCQSQESAIYSYTNVNVNTQVSATINSYSYYCQNGLYMKQAWGDRVVNTKTYKKKYNIACEMNTYISQTLIDDCDHFYYNVAIGSPVQVGTCPVEPDPCVYQVDDTPSYEDMLVASSDDPVRIAPPIEPICPQ